jgi:hypothetical protein
MPRLPDRGRAAVLAVALVVVAALFAAGCSAGPRLLAGDPAGAAGGPRCLAPDAGGARRHQAGARLRPPGPSGGRPAGTGAVITLVMPYLSPDLPHDVAAYSARYGLPAPRITMIDWHHAPPAATSSAWQAKAIREGTADAELAHAMAPGARLVYVQTPGPPAPSRAVAASGAWAGPNLTAALAWTAIHIRPDVVSISEGFPEGQSPTLAARYLPGASPWEPLMAARSGLRAAAPRHRRDLRRRHRGRPAHGQHRAAHRAGRLARLRPAGHRSRRHLARRERSRSPRVDGPAQASRSAECSSAPRKGPAVVAFQRLPCALATVRSHPG